MVSTKPLVLPIFGGQDTLTLDERTRQQLSNVCASPSGSLLLASCYRALHSEISALSPNVLEKVDICISEFKEPCSLFILPSERYFHNPLVTGPALLLIHVIRLLSYVEDTQDLSFPVLNIFQQNVDHATGILALSSGVLSACVLSASRSLLSFISNAVEAYRLALRIGLRCQIYRFETLGDNYQEYQDQSWSLVLLGTTKSEVDQFVKDFNEACGYERIFTTAVLDNKTVTVSGQPKHLQSFKDSIPVGQAICETKINSLYHCASQLSAVQRQVLGDVVERRICFPTLSDLVIPIRSTFSGDLIQNSLSSKSLVELVVDMILIHPVNWDLVLQNTLGTVSSCTPVQLINVGPGTSLARTVEREMALLAIQSTDSRDLNDYKTRRLSHAKHEPIAIVGMAVNMPSAPNVSRLWDLLENGRNTVQEIPLHRFDYAEYAASVNSGRSMKACHGNFLDDADSFDNRFFNISPREAKSMDPQQRILLHVAYDALEDAGYVPNSTPAFNSETFGCYIGAATYDYVQNLRNEIDVYYSTGTLGTFLSGRLSYCLRLSGPSVVVNTACSSSMVAIYQASRALMNRDCNAALAGGVNIITSPDMHIGLDRGHFLSPSGKSLPFDASADGYSRSEGCGIFVLKRLSDALAENDRILGVIRGIEVNQSGEACSITHTHKPSLETLFKRVLSSSDLDAISVNLVEAHAPGTQVGDVNEIESLRRVLSEKRSAKNPLFITSIKANIGHLEAASGCASLAKVLLMFRHKIIPQQISLKVFNPSIAPLERDHLVISTANLPWLPTETGQPLRALINNFGASGSNATMVLEEHIPDRPSTTSCTSCLDHNCYVFGMSAHTSLTLEIMRSNLIAWLHDPTSQHLSLGDIAYTSTARRQLHFHRIALVAGTREELILKLTDAPIVDGSGNRQIVFVFSGQGGHYRGMGRTFYSHSSIFQESIDECHRILVSSGFLGVHRVILSDPVHESEVLCEEESATATFSVQYALARLWMSFGIRPSAIMGHSLGEYAAFVISECMSLKDALILIATRSRLIVEKCQRDTSGMLAVALEPSKLESILSSTLEYSDLTIACYNSPQDCVVSGPLSQLRKLRDFLEENNVCTTTKLAIPYAFHSPTMNCVVGEFTTLAARVKVRTPRFHLISTVLGQVISPDDTSFPSRDYFVRHLVEPVLFVQGVEAFLSSTQSSKMTWLEIGPHFTMSPMLKRFPELSPSLILGSLHKRKNAMTSLSHSLASLYISNNQLNWREVFSLYGLHACISLPPYPFSKARFWTPYAEDGAVGRRHGDLQGFSLLDKGAPSSGINGLATFEAQISKLQKYLDGHRVVGFALCPASIYLELAFGAATQARNLPSTTDSIVSCRRILFIKSLVRRDNDMTQTAVQILIDSREESFKIKSSTGSPENDIIHAQGEFEWIAASDVSHRLAARLPSVLHQISVILRPIMGQMTETFSARTVYSVIFPRVVQYSPQFHTIQSLTMLAGGMEAIATLKLGRLETETFVVHPVFLDGLIHVAGFVCNLHASQEHAYICSQMDRVDINTPALDYTTSYTVFCRLSHRPDESAMSGEAFAILEGPQRVLVAHVKGILFKCVRLSALKAGLAAVQHTDPVSTSPAELSNCVASATPFETKSNLRDIQMKIIGLLATICHLDISQISPDFPLDKLQPLAGSTFALGVNKTFPHFGLDVEGLNQFPTVSRLAQAILANIKSRPKPASGLDSSLSSPEALFSPPCSKSLLKDIFSKALGIDAGVIADDDDLTLLGLDSLTTIEAVHALHVKQKINIPTNIVSSSRTITDLYARILDWQQSFSSSQTSSLTHATKHNQRTALSVPLSKSDHMFSLDNTLCLLQTNLVTSRPPLVLIHDGMGLAIPYAPIQDLKRRVFGLSNPKFFTSEPWSDIRQMAETYASLVCHQIDGPVILGGWSFGGIVAYEVAKTLLSLSIPVLGVIVIDSPDPFSPTPMVPSVIDFILKNRIPPPTKHLDIDMQSLRRAQFSMSSQLLMEYRPLESSLSETPDPNIVYLQSQEGCIAPETVVMDFPEWLRDREPPAKDSVIAGWGRLSKAPIHVLNIPGHHFGPFEPQNVAEVTRRLLDALRHLEG